MAEDFDVYVVPDIEMEDFVPEVTPSLDPTWIILDKEPGMDGLMLEAGDSLGKMGEDLNIFPFQDRDEEDRLFLARFEFPKFEGAPRYPGAIFYVPEGGGSPEGGESA
jgi:hypothetical protein